MDNTSNIFGLIWNSRVISFANDEHEEETWTTGQKIRESCRPTISRPLSSTNTVPEASATFECFNHTRQTSGNLKVVIQIPHNGSEGEPWQSRGEQATSELSDSLRAELESLIRRKHKSGPAAPMLFLWKKEKQTSAMPVPGGYVVYILIGHIKKEIPRNQPYWSGLSWYPFIDMKFRPRRGNKTYGHDMRRNSNSISSSLPPRKIARRELDTDFPWFRN